MTQPSEPRSKSSQSGDSQPFKETLTGPSTQSQGSSNSFSEFTMQRVSTRSRAVPPRTPPLRRQTPPEKPRTPPKPEAPKPQPEAVVKTLQAAQAKPIQVEARVPEFAATVPAASVAAVEAPSPTEIQAVAIGKPQQAVWVEARSPAPQQAATTASTVLAQAKASTEASATVALTHVSASPPPPPENRNLVADATSGGAVVVAPSKLASPRVKTETAEPSSLGVVRFFRAIAPMIWAIVLLLVIVPLAGRWVIAKSILPTALPDHQTISLVQPTSLTTLDEDVVTAIQTARLKTRDFAKAELDDWMGELHPRVDGFLDWYFDYFTQKRLEISAPVVWAKSAAGNALGFGEIPPGEAVNAKLTKVFQKEFTKRVLVPQTAQLRLEVITTEAAERFVADLGQELKHVQGKYRIPQGQWDRYLESIATTVSDTEGNISNLSLKTLVSGTGYVAAKPFLMVSIGKLGSKVSAKAGAKITASATAKVAAKTGTSVAAELGTSLIDPIVGVGILIWDLWDYNHQVAMDRPLLRRNLDSYLVSMEKSLLDNPETGIMAAVHQLEASVVKGVKPAKG